MLTSVTPQQQDQLVLELCTETSLPPAFPLLVTGIPAPNLPLSGVGLWTPPDLMIDEIWENKNYFTKQLLQHS